MVSWSCFVACAGFSPWTRVCSTMPVGLRVVTALPPLSGRGPAHPVTASASAKPTHRKRERYTSAARAPRFGWRTLDFETLDFGL